jgi:benzodiazapine receptor
MQQMGACCLIAAANAHILRGDVLSSPRASARFTQEAAMNLMQNDRVRQLLVLLLTVGQAALGSWSNAVLKPSNAEVSDSYVTYFIPAGLTFAVWGYLYLIVIAYGVYQMLPAQRARPLHRIIGPWVALGCAASAVWTPIFQSSGVFNTPGFRLWPLLLSLVVILVLLVSLIRVVMLLRGQTATLTKRDGWLAVLPFSSYLAWASVATIANTTVTLMALGWSSEPNGALWSTVMIAVATLIVAGVLVYNATRIGIIGFGAVIVWAYLGIYLGNNDKSALVGTAALVALTVVALIAAWRAAQRPALSGVGARA